MRVAVTTPTGNVGHHVTAMLVRAGIRPLVLARHPDHLDPQLQPLVDIAHADQFDPASVVTATRGVDALFWVDPTTGSEDPLKDYQRASTAVADAVTTNGIGRVVFQSSVGAEKRHGVGEIDGLAATELALDALDADVTHLRCGYFFTNLLLQLDAIRAGHLDVVVPIDQPMPWVAPRDIAEVAVTRLLAPDWSGRHVTAVHGPVDLTWNDVAAVLTAISRTHGAGAAHHRRLHAGPAHRGRHDGRTRRGRDRHVHRIARRVHPRATPHPGDHHPHHPRSLGVRRPASLALIPCGRAMTTAHGALSTRLG